MKPTLVLASLFAAALALPVHAEGNARMFKCVDGAGKVYYSDKMNPDCGDGTELNRHGVVLNRKEPPKPEKTGQAVPKSDPIAALKASKDQERRDRALMATYTSEEEIDAARDRSLSIPAQGIKSVEIKLEKTNEQLTAYKKQADTLASQKKSLPAGLLEDVTASQKEIALLEADLVQRRKQSDVVRAKYEADKMRFRELSGLATQASK